MKIWLASNDFDSAVVSSETEEGALKLLQDRSSVWSKYHEVSFCRIDNQDIEGIILYREECL